MYLRHLERSLLALLALSSAGYTSEAAAAQPALVDRSGWTPPPLAEIGAQGAVAADSAGYLWMASDRGVVRWDGERARVLIPEGKGPGGTVWVTALGETVIGLRRDGTMLEVTGDHTAPVRDESGAPVRSLGIRPLLVDSGLWVITDGPALAHRDPEGRWTRADAPDLPDERIYDLELAPDGDGLLVASHGGLRELGWDGSIRTIATATCWGLARFEDGRVVALVHPGAVVLHPDGRVEPLTFGPEASPIGAHDHSRYVLVHEGVAYLSEAHLDAVYPDGTAVCTRSEASRYRLGEIAGVDPEGSLWLATTDGMTRFSQPDTWLWTDKSGLSPWGIRSVTETPDRVYVTQWRERLAILEREGRAWRSRAVDGVQAGPRACVDGAGSVWMPGALSRGGVLGWLALEGDTPRMRRAARASRCFPAPDGRLWLAEQDALYEVLADGLERGPYAAPEIPLSIVLETGDGELLAGSGRTLCAADADELRAGGGWRCDLLPEAMGDNLDSLVEADGLVWANGRGLWARQGASWALHPVSEALALSITTSLAPSPRGGFWFGGSPLSGRLAHIDGQWSLVEVIGASMGVEEGSDAVWETPEGDLWGRVPSGLFYVPQAVRSQDRQVPRVALTEMALGDTLSLHVPGALALGADPPPLTIRFSALSSKDPRALRYRFRMDGGDWSQPSDEASLQLVGLAPGEHRVEIAASTDGVRFSAEPAVLALGVAYPWYRQSWFYTLVVLIVGAALYTVYRARLAVQLRLMSQRTQIAMDLHDELGAGLGSIRILASLVSEGTLPPKKAEELSGRIERAALELGAALTDIVWSLRPSSGTLDALTMHLVDRAQELFAGQETAFRASLPSPLPSQNIPLSVARHAQLIVLEALHNAARHARARQVELRLEAEGDRWALMVTDDGVGLDGSLSTRRIGGGSGLTAMRERARAIGAELTIASDEGWTEIRLILPRRRWYRW